MDRAASITKDAFKSNKVKTTNDRLLKTIKAINECLKNFEYIPSKNVPIRDKRTVSMMLLFFVFRNNTNFIYISYILQFANHFDWCTKLYKHFKEKSENDAESDKSRKRVAFAINDTHNLSTAGTVYDEPNSKHFRNYVEYIKKNKYSNEIPEQFIPLNPPSVPMINNDDEDLNFARNFEDY